MSPSPRVSAVVLTYDGRELLDVILPSLEAQTHPELQVVLVDNGGSDGSSAYVRERWPEVKIVRLERNVGVAAAFNRGIEAADGELVGILNDDLELDPGTRDVRRGERAII